MIDLHQETIRPGPTRVVAGRNGPPVAMLGHAAMWLGLVVVSVFPGTAAAEPPRIVAGPMFTPAGDGYTRVWIQMDRPAGLLFQLNSATGGPPGQYGLTTREDHRNIGSLRLRFPPAGRSRLRIMDAGRGQAGELLVLPGPLKRPPRAGAAGRYTFAFGSCLHTERFPSQPIWTAITQENPDCFLLLGDNVYLPNRSRKFADDRAAAVKTYRDCYDAQMRVPELQALLRSTFVFATWDDHDYGPNNSDRTWKWKDVALQVFKEYFPNDYGVPGVTGCFQKFSWGDVDCFMLDDRTFRDPNDDPKRRTMLGDEQLAWLKDGLKASTATVKVIACGNQMLSDHGGEGWGVQFRPERDAFLDWLWEKRITGVVFISGDVHYAELIRKRDSKGRGPDLWELTSSPLANFHHPLAGRKAAPNRVGIYPDGLNYGVLSIDTTASVPSVGLRIHNERGDVVIARTIRLGL